MAGKPLFVTLGGVVEVLEMRGLPVIPPKAKLPPTLMAAVCQR